MQMICVYGSENITLHASTQKIDSVTMATCFTTSYERVTVQLQCMFLDSFRPIMIFEWQIEVTVQMSRSAQLWTFHYVSLSHDDEVYKAIIWWFEGDHLELWLSV